MFAQRLFSLDVLLKHPLRVVVSDMLGHFLRPCAFYLTAAVWDAVPAPQTSVLE